MRRVTRENYREAEMLATLALAWLAVDAEPLLDPQVLVVVTLNPESRVKAARGPARAVLQQAGYTPVLVKVVNESGYTGKLLATSPQAEGPGRFLHARVVTGRLSGKRVEYAEVLIACAEAGRREATIGFDIGGGNQDLGFRGEVPILFEVRPAVEVRTTVTDPDGRPVAAEVTFRDAGGRVVPPEPLGKRADGRLLLPPGDLTATFGGTGQRLVEQAVMVAGPGPVRLDLRLERGKD
jgi:hypothetical protein